ncbi:MAG: PUA domain-containing protein [Candidatus Kariarchaeaceae archaeon]|jgi:PUA domain protein
MAKRESLSSRERKELIARLETILEDPAALLPKKGKTVKHLMDDGNVAYIANNTDLVLIKLGDYIIPSLRIARKVNLILPKIVVDLGAIKFVTNGADIMRPGITEIDPNIVEGQLIVVVEEKNGAPLCFGVARFDAVDMQRMDSGRVIQNLHYLSDTWFNFEI